MQRCSMAFNSGGTSARRLWSGVGGSRRIFVIVSSFESPVNGLWPESISYKSTPNEKTSLRASAGWPFTCSGDM